jgi:lipid II:glycine glycyltransferase (peptidoglycan interpeptide bridge formation enzyme)
MGVPSSSKNPPQIHGQEWNAITSALPGAHILQTWEWGKVKAKFGWQPHYLVWNRANDRIELTIDRSLEGQKNKQPVAAALTLQRNIGIGGFSRRMGVLYVPKGPLLDWNDQA